MVPSSDVSGVRPCRGMNAHRPGMRVVTERSAWGHVWQAGQPWTWIRVGASPARMHGSSCHRVTSQSCDVQVAWKPECIGGHTSIASLARYARPSAEALQRHQERTDPARRR